MRYTDLNDRRKEASEAKLTGGRLGVVQINLFAFVGLSITLQMNFDFAPKVKSKSIHDQLCVLCYFYLFDGQRSTADRREVVTGTNQLLASVSQSVCHATDEISLGT